MLPYNEKKGYKLLSKIQKHLNKSLPTKLKATATYQSKKLGMKFKIKGKAKFLSKKTLFITVSIRMKHAMKIA